MKFFDKTTKTLFTTEGKTNVIELSNNPLIQVGDTQNGELLPYTLRRLDAGIKRHYISSTTGQELYGNYDLSHYSNSDLVKVRNIIACP